MFIYNLSVHLFYRMHREMLLQTYTIQIFVSAPSQGISLSLNVAVQFCNPSTGKAEVGGLPQYQGYLGVGFTVSSMTVWYTSKLSEMNHNDNNTLN